MADSRSMSNRLRNCPVCGAAADHVFLVREGVPVHQNLLMETAAAARAIARGTIELVACTTCGFVFNRAFEEQNLAYGERYENAQDCSPAFAAYAADLAEQILRDGARGARIVEVGCGKGTFLRRLVDDPATGNTGLGFDPAYTGPDDACGGRLHFRRAFFDAASSDEPVDVVVCRHVIEHVAAPASMLEAVRAATGAAAHARAYFETPCVNWVLRNGVIWDVFYEHCSYFNARSLRYAFERSGFAVANVRHVFGGQYLWLEASPAAHAPAPRPHAGDVRALADAFSAAHDALVEGWREKLSDAAERGKVAVWGAGAKGVTFANLLDPDRAVIDCLIDLNPRKQGMYVPGTGHPIVSYLEAAVRGVRTAVLMNPNYQSENVALLTRARLDIELQA
jgi:hypothetical protein